ncbi:MAG TPA: DUF5808 domain-containing protein [Chloroflexota bacterium]|jgi:uncharacterized membrane protein|nr:DUF5808 domain-containing protein [Chloroflexota bacterium]
MRRLVLFAATLAVVVFAATRRQKVGTWEGIPYDWRWPTPAVIRERFWNPADSRIFTPKVFGWGWSINIPALLRRLGG